MGIPLVYFEIGFSSFFLSGIQASYAMELLENVPDTPIANHIIVNTPDAPSSKRIRLEQDENNFTQEEKDLFKKRARKKLEFDSDSDSSSDFD